MSSGWPGLARGAQQEFLQLGRAFAVAPVADPDQPFALAFPLGRVEAAQIRRLVPDMHAAAPAPAAIDLGQRLAERQHVVIARQVEGAHLLGRADGAVVGVVEHQPERRAAFAQRADAGDQFRLVPFVDDDQIRAVGHRLDIGIGAVDGGAQVRIRLLERGKPLLAVIGQQVLAAPCALRLIGDRVVPPLAQFVQHAAQEMGIAMVPARGERVSEIDDPHAAASSPASICR